jgi:hypothetical protein
LLHRSCFSTRVLRGTGRCWQTRPDCNSSMHFDHILFEAGRRRGIIRGQSSRSTDGGTQPSQPCSKRAGLMDDDRLQPIKFGARNASFPGRYRITLGHRRCSPA